jgi:ubiquinone/menaquinone biosynthesis C-methylase UbiE
MNEKFLPQEITAHYDLGIEEPRLRRSQGLLEFVRTQEIVRRRILPPPAVIWDVGGGPGIYSCWLASLGYEVHLLDAVPLHVQQAKTASASQRDHPIASIHLGDARSIPASDRSADVVLLFGPLYHLVEKADRLASLAQAARILKPNGILLCAAISRFASAFDGICRNLLADPVFLDIVKQDLESGQHRNPKNHPWYFTTAFFHHPEELAREMAESGFVVDQVLGVEGPGWLLQDFDERWKSQEGRERILWLARTLEAEPSLLGMSAHLLGIGRLPSSSDPG